MSDTGGDGTALALAYAFIPTPSPILASAGSANSNVIDLQVIVSNAQLETIVISEIDIEIPVGADDSDHLSASRTLPTLPDDPASPWHITVGGEVVTIRPRTGDPLALTNAIVFTLVGIRVGTQAGTVQVAITENQAPPGAQAYDDTTYTLLKQPATFQITSFSATPSMLTDVDQSTVLTWACSEEGKQLSYAISIKSIGGESVASGAPAAGSAAVPGSRPTPTPPRGEAGVGDTYTWQDGQTGVTYSPIFQTTTFELDAIQAESIGKDVIVASAETTVLVTTPWISPNSSIVGSPTGRFVWLHWLAANARSCTLQCDNDPQVEGLPTDTYKNGYLTIFLGASESHVFALTALPTIGDATRTVTFLAPPMTAPATISVAGASIAAALTPDGSLALVANLRSDAVTVVDIATQHVEEPPIRVGQAPCSIAITPDGLTALVSNGNDATVSVIDVPSRMALRPAIPLPGADVLAISPDGTLAFVASITDGATPNGLYAIDMATLTVLSPMIQIPTTISGIAFSADGTLAYVTDSDNESVIVIDVLAREVKPARIHVGAYPMGIAISSDGLTALVGNAGDDTVSMIDLPTHHVSSPIPVGQGPQAVAITPDGAYGLAANLVSNDLTIINLAQQTTQTIGTGKDPIAVVVSQTGPSAANGEPGGPAVLVVNQGDQTVMLI